MKVHTVNTKIISNKTDLDSVLKLYKNNNIPELALDIETRGYKPLEGNLHGIGLSDGNYHVYILFEPLKDYLFKFLTTLDNCKVWLFHNYKFECRWLKQTLNFEFTYLHDTLLAYYAKGGKELKLSTLAGLHLLRYPHDFEGLILAHNSNLEIKSSKTDDRFKIINKVECPKCLGTCKMRGKVLKYPKSKFIIELFKDTLYDKESVYCIKNLKGKYKGVIEYTETTEDGLYKQIKCDECKGEGIVNNITYSYGVDLVPVQALANYCGEDCYETFLLWQQFHTARQLDSKLNDIYTIELGCLPYIIMMEDEGCKIDDIKIQALEIKVSKAIEGYKKLWDGLYPEISITSHNQLKLLFFGTLELDKRCTPDERELLGKTELTDAYQTSTSNLQLLKYLAEDTIDIKLEHGRLTKLHNTYLTKLHGIIYTQFNQAYTDTGRLSSSSTKFYDNSTNLQNIPNPNKSKEGKLVRQCFIPKRDNHSILCLDYSQFELRILAHFASTLIGDSFLKNIFIEGKDPHTIVASIMFGFNYNDYDKNNPTHVYYRTISKTINFGVVYGMGSTKLAQMLSIPLEEAKHKFSLHKESLPGIWDIIYYLRLLAISNGYSKTLWGRKRYYDFYTESLVQLKDNKDILNVSKSKFWHDKLVSKIHPKDGEQLRQASNAPIQGTNADIIKSVMGKIYHKIYLGHYENIYPILQVHDELVFEVENSMAELYLKAIARDMQDGISFDDLPVLVSGSVADNWGDAK